jgi:hypothetical protein
MTLAEYGMPPVSAGPGPPQVPSIPETKRVPAVTVRPARPGPRRRRAR